MGATAPLHTIQRIAIFPLPGAVLFPGLHLPLHIFEPRYKAMVQEVLARLDHPDLPVARQIPGEENVEPPDAADVVERGRLDIFLAG
ncbi:MAG: LON peptidase substrate-binding domain-containing protein, partial [Sphingopyxis sp.]|nr:LON peptidase substrate-binding domain-containing protein [Sphingopyxis sp.]